MPTSGSRSSMACWRRPSRPPESVPRIDAPTLAEHVANQTRAVLTAAAALFAERGYAAVSIGDIAAAAGLRRSSLYRYFPDKAQLALQLIEQELEAQAVAEQEAARGDAALAPVEQAQRWALRQLDYAERPEHALLVDLATALAGTDHPAAAALRGAHERAREPLLAALAATPAAGQAGWVAAMIEGVVLASARASEAPDAPSRDEQRAALKQAIATLVG